jgi:hypothetical protein
MTSNIHISWDGPFMKEEQVAIRHLLEQAIIAGDWHVCQCGILLLMVCRGDMPSAFGAHFACGCGSQSEDRLLSILSEKTTPRSLPKT